MVSRAQKVFDDNGVIVDPATEEQLRQFVEGFVQFAQSNK
jgi:hypothetical protein